MSECYDFEIYVGSSREHHEAKWDYEIDPNDHETSDANLYFHREDGLVFEGSCMKETIPSNYVRRAFLVKISLDDLNSALEEDIDGGWCRFKINRLSEMKGSVQTILETLSRLSGISDESESISPDLYEIWNDVVDFIKVVTAISGAEGIAEVYEP